MDIDYYLLQLFEGMLCVSMVQLREVNRELRARSGTIILVVSSVTAAFAALFGLTVWVSGAAALAATFTGIRALNTELVVPARARAAANATARIASGDGQSGRRWGTAVQISPGHWLTAAHVVDEDDAEVRLNLNGAWTPVTVVYCDQVSDLAVVTSEVAVEWQARCAQSEPQPGDRLHAIGWITRESFNTPVPMRVALEYTVQGPSGGSTLVLTGPAPQAGFSGAAVLDAATGRLAAIFVSYSQGSSGLHGGLQELAIAHAIPISALPNQYR